MSEEGMKLLGCAFITDSGIRRIRRGHAGGKESRGQQSLAPAGFANLPKILN